MKSASAINRESELRLAQAFLRAANKCRISLRDRRDLITKFGCLQKLLQNQKFHLEKENYELALREDIFFNFQVSYREAYRQLCSEDKEISSDISVKLCNDELFPNRLKEIDSCPCLLFGKGDNWEILNSSYQVAVIGSRTPSHYGMEVTRCLVSDLAQAGIVVISGGAVGIDTLAHRHSLAAGGRTCAVLGSGISKPYPHSNKKLFGDISSQEGLVISEFLPDEPPRKRNFPQRNRLIAALADALIVTEAGAKSGTLITADFAADYGRDVFAVPGSIFSGRSRACHQLIKEGASLLQSADDLDMIQSRQLGFTLSSKQETVSNTKEENKFSKEECLVLQCLCIAPSSLTELSRKSELPVDRLALILAHLQKDGFVDRARGLYTSRVSGYNF